MKTFFEQVGRLSFISIMGLVGSVTVGLIMHGNEVFNYAGVSFVYVSFGLSGALIFAFYHEFHLSNAITAAVTISALQFVIASAWMPLVNAVCWSFGVNLPVIGLAFLFERKLSVFHWAKFVVVGLVYGTMFVLLTLLVGVLTRISSMPPSVFRENFIDGMLIGLGVGLGVQAGEASIQSLKKTGDWPTHRA